MKIKWKANPAVSVNRSFYTAKVNGKLLSVVYGYDLDNGMYGWLCKVDHGNILQLCNTAAKGKAYFKRYIRVVKI